MVAACAAVYLRRGWKNGARRKNCAPNCEPKNCVRRGSARGILLVPELEAGDQPIEPSALRPLQQMARLGGVPRERDGPADAAGRQPVGRGVGRPVEHGWWWMLTGACVVPHVLEHSLAAAGVLARAVVPHLLEHALALLDGDVLRAQSEPVEFPVGTQVVARLHREADDDPRVGRVGESEEVGPRALVEALHVCSSRRALHAAKLVAQVVVARAAEAEERVACRLVAPEGGREPRGAGAER